MDRNIGQQNGWPNTAEDAAIKPQARSVHNFSNISNIKDANRKVYNHGGKFKRNRSKLEQVNILNY